MFLSTMQTLPFEDHNMAYQCKGLGQSNIVCEYEVNLSTNEKVITEKQNFRILGSLPLSWVSVVTSLLKWQQMLESVLSYDYKQRNW